MADSIYTFDPTASNNTTLDSIPYGPNQLYHNKIDDWFRAVGAKLAQFRNDLGGVVTVGGTGDAVTVTLSSGITAYATGQTFMFKAGAANTGAATMNVNAIGAKAIRKISGGTDVALAAGDIAQANRYTVVYDSAANAAAGAFILAGSSVSAATTTTAGVVELATNAETITGTDATRAVTPSTLYYPTGHLYGLTLSNNASDATNDIDIAAGNARDGSDTVNIVLAAALTKRLDAAWAVGTNQGGLDTGSIANTTYHVWLIKRSDTGVVDVLFSTSASAPTMPANYDYKRRIGSIIRTGGAISSFVQDGDEFLYAGGIVADVAVTNLGTTATLYTLSVPLGLKVKAIFSGTVSNGSAGRVVLFTSPDQLDQAPGNIGQVVNQLAATGSLIGFGQIELRTDTSRRIRARSDNTNTFLNIGTHGWIDTRGRV